MGPNGLPPPLCAPPDTTGFSQLAPERRLPTEAEEEANGTSATDGRASAELLTVVLLDLRLAPVVGPSL